VRRNLRRTLEFNPVTLAIIEAHRGDVVPAKAVYCPIQTGCGVLPAGENDCCFIRHLLALCICAAITAHAIAKFSPVGPFMADQIVFGQFLGCQP